MSYIPITSETYSNLEEVLQSRLFVHKSFSNYSGPSGLYDFIHNGSLLKSNITSAWKKIFASNSIELDSSILTPYSVLKQSGHVDKFDDIIVYDLETQKAYRADHYLEGKIPSKILKNIEQMPSKEIEQLIKEYEIKSPEGNDMGNVKKFNLMFKSSIGANKSLDTNINKIFLRPETAQSQFLLFPKLFKALGTFPISTFTIGKSFRNEISPRNGLIRLREFEQAELEYFCSPYEDFHKEFESIKEEIVTLEYFTKLDGNVEEFDFKIEDTKFSTIRKTDSLENFLEQKVLNSKTVATFIGLSNKFYKQIGLNSSSYFFRRHRPNEMAHYANDCWDTEVKTIYGDIECGGIADRGQYDLSCHKNADNFVVCEEIHPEKASYKIEVKKMKFDRKKANSVANKENFYSNLDKIIEAELEKRTEKINKLLNKTLIEDVNKILINKTLIEEVNKEINNLSISNNKILTSEKELITSEKELLEDLNFTYKEINFNVKLQKKLVTTKSFIPKVIEPSFGITRILHCVLEQSFKTRGIDTPTCNCPNKDSVNFGDQEKKFYFSFNKLVCPQKINVSVLRNSYLKQKECKKMLERLNKNLQSFKPKIVERNVSIGKKYVEADEQGVFLYILVDEQSFEDDSVTIRCRECTQQVRVKIDDVFSEASKFFT